VPEFKRTSKDEAFKIMAKEPQAPRKPGKKRTAARSLDIVIERLNDEGIGVARHEGKELLVAGALKGETVSVVIEHQGQYQLIGRLGKVLRKSPSRTVVNNCKHAGACQGCSLIAMNYQSQLYFKQDKIRYALDAYDPLKGIRLHPVWGAAHPFGYRTNAKLVMGKERGKVKIGLYRRGSHDVVDIEDCPLHHPLINRIAKVVKEEVERQEIYIYNSVTRRGLLRYLAIKVSPGLGKAMVTFVTAERNFRELTHMAKGLKAKVPEVVSVQQNINPSSGNVILGKETVRILGTPDLIDQVGDIQLRIAPSSFFQVNNDQAARIYQLVREWAALSPGDCAVDLYCGIGGIAMNLARDGARVIGIEVVEEAVRNARENARMNNIRTCTFVAGDAAELVHDLALEIPPGGVAVVNPPRSGCDREVLEALAGLEPRTLIYVSCNPLTLARDLDILSSLGYRTEEIQPVDMFPQTPHIEAVARLVPAQG
jgi:23S rRNA (uracil1939-C5)-methyltransferase